MILILLIPTKIELCSASFWSTSGAHLGIHPHFFPASFWRSLNWTLLWLWHQAAPNNLPGSPSLGSSEVLAVLNHPVRDPQCGAEEILLRWEAPGYTGIMHLLIMGRGHQIMLKSMGWILRDLPLQSSMKFGFGVPSIFKFQFCWIPPAFWSAYVVSGSHPPKPLHRGGRGKVKAKTQGKGISGRKPQDWKTPQVVSHDDSKISISSITMKKKNWNLTNWYQDMTPSWCPLQDQPPH